MQSVIKKGYNILIKFLNSIKYRHIKIQVKCSHRWYGSSYGGFYVNPDYIEDAGVVYSFGIGQDISFDKEVIKRHNCTVFGFDPTPKSIQWCAQQALPKQFFLYPFGIYTHSGHYPFNLPINTDYVSGSIINHKALNKENQLHVEMKSFEDHL